MQLFLFSGLIATETFFQIGAITGQGDNDCYYHIAGLRDVNGDGFDDFMVGASAGGYTHLFLGASIIDTLADYIFRPDSGSYSGTYGTSICGDDWNGDGYNDIAIGQPHWSEGGYPAGIFSSGKVWVYFGGSEIDTIPDLELVVANLDDFTGWYYRFGTAVASGGDVNGDGYHDLIASAPSDDIDNHGRVYIYYGGPNMDNEWDVLLEGTAPNDMFGQSIDIVGDIDQDGNDDLLIGAPQDYAGLDGKAYLVYGRTEISLENSVVFDDDSTIGYLSYGRKVSRLGDVNDDGVNDFGVMSTKYIDFINGDDMSRVRMHTNIDWWSFNYVCGGFDYNQDGLDDFVLGANNRGDHYKGIFLAFDGSSNWDTIPDYEISGNTDYGYFANEICYLGDVNADGDPDFLISEALSGVGRVYLYSYGVSDAIYNPKKNQFPSSKQLIYNYPNPFNSTTIISYEILNPGFVQIIITDITGRVVSVVQNEMKTGGLHEVTWELNGESSSVYFYSLYLDHQLIETRKMLHLK